MKYLLLLIAFVQFTLNLNSQTIPDPKPMQILKKQDGAVLSLAFQPDGKVLASGSEDKHVCYGPFRKER